MLRRQCSTIWVSSTTLLLVVLFAVGLVGLAWAQPQAQQVQEGQAIFQAQCAACHTIGGGPLAGPDLEGVAARRPRDWLVQWIAAPDQVLAGGDPTATQLLHEWNDVPMPNMGLTQSQVEAVVAYLEAPMTGSSTPAPPGTANPPVAPAPTAGPAAGDPTRGRALFTGSVHLKSGGPPCIACHSTAGLPALGGGSVGPDLTQALTRYGGTTGLAAVLASIPFPTMKPVYMNHPLAPQDQADLIAFLQGESQRQPHPPAVPPGLVAGGGALLLLGLVPAIWHRRLHDVRQSLVNRAKNR